MRTHRSARSVRALSGLLLAAALALTGCSAGGSDSGSDSGSAYDASDRRAEGSDAKAATGAGGAAAAKGTPKLAADHVIRTASLTVRVADVPKALDAARAATVDAGGYVGDETTDRDGEDHERTRVVLRVPVERYDEVLTALQGAGTLVARTAKAQDVTDEVVDVDSRVRSQRASVARVRALMDRAAELSDVVELERELGSREADLEALLARQASLKDRTALATVTLRLTEAPAERERHEAGFLDALEGGATALATTLRWVALAVGAVLPFAAVAALLWLGWLRLVRPVLSRRAGRGPAPLRPPQGPGPV